MTLSAIFQCLKLHLFAIDVFAASRRQVQIFALEKLARVDSSYANRS